MPPLWHICGAMSTHSGAIVVQSEPGLAAASRTARQQTQSASARFDRDRRFPPFRRRASRRRPLSIHAERSTRCPSGSASLRGKRPDVGRRRATADTDARGRRRRRSTCCRMTRNEHAPNRSRARSRRIRESSWLTAYEAFARADEAEPLEAEDLELLTMAMLMLGRDDEAVAILERAHHRYAERGQTLRAVRSATWIGMNLAYRGGRARNRLARARAAAARHGPSRLPSTDSPDPARVPTRGGR